jgi:hypothetical protein
MMVKKHHGKTLTGYGSLFRMNGNSGNISEVRLLRALRENAYEYDLV